MMTQLRQRMLEELQRRTYVSGTIRLYLRHVAAFARHFHRSPDQLGAEDIRQLFLIQEKKLALSSYNQIVCALRFFYYAKTLKRAFLLQDIPFPRKTSPDPQPGSGESPPPGIENNDGCVWNHRPALVGNAPSNSAQVSALPEQMSITAYQQ
jgi:hypothetical protein